MKKTWLPLLFLVMAPFAVVIGQINLIPFDTKNCGVFQHPVSSVTVYDQRPKRQEIMGWMQVRDAIVPIVAKNTLQESVDQYYLGLSEKMQGNPKLNLSVVIHRFYLSEKNQDGTTSFEYCADYFIETGQDEYLLLGTVDTVLHSRKRRLSSSLLSSVDNCLCFLYEQLFNIPLDTSRRYSLYAAQQRLVTEKEKLAAYRASRYPDGVYMEWEDFLLLRNNDNETVLRKGDKIKVIHEGQKKAPFESNMALVYVLDSVPYYNLDGRLYPMERFQHDFFIRVSVRELSQQAFILLSGMGVMMMIQKPAKRNNIELLVDYKSGRLLKIKDLDAGAVHYLRL